MHEIATVIAALVPALTSVIKWAEMRPLRKEAQFPGGDGVARLLGWVVSASLTTSEIRKDDPEMIEWQHHVARVQSAAEKEDYEEVSAACDEWGGDYLKLITALDSDVLVPVVRDETRVSRQFRVGEQFAISLLHNEAADERGHEVPSDGSAIPSGTATRAALRTLFESTPPDLADTQEQLAALLAGFIAELDLDDFTKLDPEDCEQVGRNAARDALASLRWTKVVGDRIDTTEATRLLGVSRQAIAQRVSAGSILGIPGRRTTYFPTWQFDLTERSIRPEVTLILNEFRSRMGNGVDPLVVASWMASPQAELDGATPITWLGTGQNASRLVLAARHSASRAAR